MGGLERHVQCLAQSLPKEVESLICVTGCDGAASEAMRDAGLNVVTLGCSSGHDLRLLPRFRRVMKEFKPDVVHGHSVALLASVYLKWRSTVPLIQSLHTPASTRTLKDRLFDWIAKKPDYFLPVSAETWKGYKKLYPTTQGEVLFNPLFLSAIPTKDSDYVRRELGLSADVPLIGMVGRMSPPKNWFGFLDVSLGLLSRNEMLHVVAVGDGPQHDEIHAKWREMTQGRSFISDRLHFLGNRQDAKQLIGGMDVFLFLSHHEELPTVLLEAFGMRTPVVGNLPVGGTKEVLALSTKESAWLVEAYDRETIMRNTEVVLADKGRADSMTQEGCGILETHFDAQKICSEQLMDIYRKVMR